MNGPGRCGGGGGNALPAALCIAIGVVAEQLPSALPPRQSHRSEEGIADTETREPARRGARAPPACLPRIDTPPHVGPTPTTITMTKHPTKPERIIPHCFIAPTPSNALCLGCLYLTSFYRGGIPQVDIHTESGRTGLGGRDNWGRARLMRVHTPKNLACCGF